MRALLVRGLLLSCVVAGGAPAVGDEAVTARRIAGAEHLLHAHRTTFAGDMAGFNRRNAICDRDAAAATAAYDATHAASFKRMIGWRWDTGRTRWMSAPVDAAEVTLAYSGPVRSGPMTIDGRSDSFCRAEAPDRLESRARVDGGRVERLWYGQSVELPKLASDARPTEPLGSAASTPPPERQARIAKAQSLIDEETKRLELRADAGNAPSDCPAMQVHAANGPTFHYAKSLRHDGARDAWVDSESASPDVELVISTPWDPKTILDRKCFAFRPVTLVARAAWQNEGSIVLTFRVDLPRKPTPPARK